MRVRRKAHYERKYRAKRAASLSRSVVSHSHTTKLVQPGEATSTTLRRSRSTLARNFSNQNSRRVVGVVDL